MDLESIRRLNLAEIKPINDTAPKKQSLKEWAMAGGGVPHSHKGREDVWHKKSANMAEQHFSKAGAVKSLAKNVMEAVAPKAAKAAVEAPTIMLPSSLSNLQKKVIDKKGAYGGKRVQRAADEIPRLDQKYTEDALSQAFLGDNAKALMTMDPADFEKYAATLASYHMDPNSVRYTSSGKSINYPEYMSDYLPNVGAFDEVPFLQIDKQEAGLPLMPFISGHEGRHRSRVMAAKGENAGLVQLYPSYRLREDLPRQSQEEYIEALKRELEMTGNKVDPQRFFDDSMPKNLLIERPPIDLPDVYAKGGEVHMAEGGNYGRAGGKQREPKLSDLTDLQYPLKAGLDMLAGGLRGATAATLGAPADVLNLLKVGNETPDIPYGSDYFLKNLPSAGTSEGVKYGEAIGEYIPLPSQVATVPAKMAYKGAKAGAKAVGKGASAAGRYVEDAAQRSLDELGSASPFVTFSNLMPDTKMGIIKKGGGEWKKGSIDERLEDVKRYEIGTSADRDYRIKLYDEALAIGDMTPEAHALAVRQNLVPPTINKFVDKKLAPYVRNQMGTAEDPIRLLADEGVTHFSPLVQRVFGDLNFDMTKGTRAAGGFPAEGVAQTPLGKLWEDVSDSSIRINPASKVYGGQELPPYLQPDTPVHSAGRFDQLAFDSLTSQLEQDLLAGRITPQQADKLSVSDVVRRAHNTEQEKQAAELAEKVAAGKNMTTYAPATTEGSRWVKLEKPGDFARESDAMGHSIRGYEPEVGHPEHIKVSGNQGRSSYGHGGWEAIKSGEASAISLRDADNASSATLEFKASKVEPTDEELDSMLRKAYEDAAQELGESIRFASPTDPMPVPETLFPNVRIRANSLYYKSLDNFESKLSDVADVTQIKGKGNMPLTEEARQETKNLLNSKPYRDINFKDLKANNLYDTQSSFEETYNSKSEENLQQLLREMYQGDDFEYAQNKLDQLVGTNKIPRIVTEEDIVKAIRNPRDPSYAAGGEVHMSKAGAVKDAVGALKKAFKSEKYLPDVQYADPLKPPTMKMSEALGNSGSEGKILRLTEADRSRVFGPNRGGVGFSALQHYSEPHKNARTVWGFGNETTTRKKINQNDPENTVWSTYAGSPTQHKSNTVVIKDAIKTLQAANNAGQVHPEQIKMINERIRQAVTGDKGKEKFLFPDSFDITDPDALSLAGTFDRRAVISDALMGVGVKGPMKSVAFRQANPDAFFTDASQLESILARETDPALMNASTYDVGPHLFVMDNGMIHRPDLNEAFPYQVTGDDLGFRFEPTPIRLAAPDFTMNVPLDEAINSYKMSRGNPSQLISEEYLTNLQKRGYADGGTVKASKKKGGLASLSKSKRG